MTESTASLSASRKDDHVRLALQQAEQRSQRNDFDDLNFLHHALASVDQPNVSLTTSVLGGQWGSPLYINAMTGGSAQTAQINESLARVAAASGIAVASGSMSPIFKDPDTEHSFKVLRTLNPNGTVFANINANAGAEEAKKAVGLLEANALQVHINSVQELAMPEGDRAFEHWPRNIETIVAATEVPVIVKEVGFGMSRQTVNLLQSLGVKAVDVAGKGGTNFAKIEQNRADSKVFEELNAWGLSTVKSLLDIEPNPEITVFASGGVRNAMDAAKSLALGASAVGVAGGFLQTLKNEGEEALIAQIRRWQDNLVTVQTLLGLKRTAEFNGVQVLITGSVAEFCSRRNIDIQKFAMRTQGEQTA